MLDIAEERHVNRTACTNCCEMILGKQRYKLLLKEGAFFLLPEWLENWKDIFENQLGLSPEVARDLMNNRCFKLIYLDTGVLDIPMDKIRECGEYLGIEVKIMQVGMENLKSELIEANIVGGKS